MASVCGTSLALMDAGVPIKAPVAGVAMGLVKEGERFQVLTDILGDEDHLGDMDFKVAGTATASPPCRWTSRSQGITQEIMQVALDQARDGRLHILGEMNKVLAKPRENMSEWAPTIITMKIDPEKIRDVIGKGGAVIRQHHRRDRHVHRYRERRHGEDRLGAGAAGREAQRRIEVDHRGRRSRPHLRRQGRELMDFGAFVDHSARPRRPGAHLADFRGARREASATSSRKAMWSGSRCWKWISREGFASA